MSLRSNLTLQVLLCVTFGVLIGWLAPATGEALKPLGDGFVKLVKMMIGPIIFLTITTGIAQMDDVKKVGKLGFKALLYFEIVTTLALVIGLVVVNITQPGAGLPPPPQSAESGVAGFANQAKQQHIIDFLLAIIPDTAISAFTQGNLLQVLFISILSGVALSLLGEKGRPLVALFDSCTQLCFRMIAIIMKFAPLGALGAMAFTVGKYGLESLVPLARLMLDVYLTMFLFIVFVLGGILRYYGFSLWRLLRYLKEELLLVLGTSSSESALPRLMEKLEKAGCPRPVVGLVVPTGYSFNLDGTSIYLSMAAIFIAQVYHIDLSLSQQLGLLGILLITSKGAAGVTGSGFITLAATLSATGILPVEGMALLLGVDRFMSEARAITNLIGNAVATLVMAKVEKGWQDRGVL